MNPLQCDTEDRALPAPRIFSRLTSPTEKAACLPSKLSAFRSLLQNRPYDEQYRVVHRDGAIRWVRDRGFPIRNSFDAMYRVARITTGISAEADAAARRRRAIEEGIRDALQNNAFSLHYQPQVFLDSQKVIGVEALLRWENCSIPSLACSELITVADETGLIIQIGEWVLRNACRQSKCWQQDAGIEDLRMAVNVSAKQLKHPGFFDLIEQILRETGLSPHSLELEIAERVLMENNQGNIAVLQALKDKGIYISVDDFGTGFSSLSYLKHFPVDALKIDQIFVRGIPQDKHDAAIASAIIGMAHSLKMEVVAEGIECDEQSVYLRSLGCDFGQGYLFSRPVPAQELTEKLARRGWA